MDNQQPTQSPEISPETNVAPPSVPELPEHKPSSAKLPVVAAVVIAIFVLVVAGAAAIYLRNSKSTVKNSVTETNILVTPTPVVTPTPSTNWQTYTNTKYNYSINYPTDWTIREFPDSQTGATFRPSDLPNDYQYEYISINKYNRVMFDGQPSLPLPEYVAKAGAEIQNYGELQTMDKIMTEAGITGYTATFQGGGSSLRTYFAIPGNETATVQVVLDNPKYQSIYKQMLASFKIVEKKPPQSTNPNLKTYHSDKLGVSFTYLEKQDSQTIHVFEKNNIICVTYDATDANCEKGQSLEVFQKEATETLKSAINRLFLVGKDLAKCLVSISDPNNYPATFVKGEITYPKDDNFSMETMSTSVEYCSPNYAQTNGIRYFLEDKSHPTKFVFLSIGQYGIASEGNKTWQETVSWK